VIPRYKASYSVAWTLGKVTTTLFGTRLGGLPNYDGTERLSPTNKFNGSMHVDIGATSSLTFVVNNLFDQKPQTDPSWSSYPYYASRWFDSIGRAVYVQWTTQFGKH